MGPTSKKKKKKQRQKLKKKDGWHKIRPEAERL